MRSSILTLTVAVAAAGCHRAAAPARPDAGAARTAAPETLAPPPPRGKQITIVYSSNLLGEYEPCG